MHCQWHSLLVSCLCRCLHVLLLVASCTCSMVRLCQHSMLFMILAGLHKVRGDAVLFATASVVWELLWG